MQNYTKRTIYGNAISTAQQLGTEHVILANSTLNEKFQVATNIDPTSTDLPALGYLAIGRGGHSLSIGADQQMVTNIVPHTARHAALYEHIPFVVRKVNEDLSEAERLNYGLRVEQEINGEDYFIYYLKRTVMTTDAPNIEYVTIVDGVEQRIPFVPTTEDLNPRPPTVNNDGVSNATSDKLECSVNVILNLSASEIADIVDACTIVFGGPEYAVISEMALCTGIDQPIPYTDVNGQIYNLIEVVHVQVSTFINCNYDLRFSTDGLDLTIVAGSDEPVAIGG